LIVFYVQLFLSAYLLLTVTYFKLEIILQIGKPINICENQNKQVKIWQMNI